MVTLRIRPYRNISEINKIRQKQLFDTDDNGHKNGLNNGFCNGISPGLKKDREIVRMSCIKSAIYLTRDFGGMDIGDRTENVIDVAKNLKIISQILRNCLQQMN